VKQINDCEKLTKEYRDQFTVDLSPTGEYPMFSSRIIIILELDLIFQSDTFVKQLVV
jgi:hypothetical protein